MNIREVSYLASFQNVISCPKDKRPVYAFVGRSNVGKSSLINMLCGRKEIARVSKSPGKTQSINYYLVDQTWYLADLPGFGYAKVSRKSRKQWGRMIEEFLHACPYLVTSFLLIDIRHLPLDPDLEFIRWMGENQISFCIVFTKSDKIKGDNFQKTIETYKNELRKSWDKLPEIFISSATTGAGKEEILRFIQNLNNILTDRE